MYVISGHSWRRSRFPIEGALALNPGQSPLQMQLTYWRSLYGEQSYCSCLTRRCLLDAESYYKLVWSVARRTSLLASDPVQTSGEWSRFATWDLIFQILSLLSRRGESKLCLHAILKEPKQCHAYVWWVSAQCITVKCSLLEKSSTFVRRYRFSGVMLPRQVSSSNFGKRSVARSIILISVFCSLFYRDSQDRGAGVIGQCLPFLPPRFVGIPWLWCFAIRTAVSGYTGKGKERLKLDHRDSFFNDWSSDDQKVQNAQQKFLAIYLFTLFISFHR